MPKKLKVSGQKWVVIVCVIFFLVGVLVGRIWLTPSVRIATSPSQNSSSNQSQSLLTFEVPQVPLPPNWAAKTGLPGNSFESALPLSPGVQTEGTLSPNDAVDYYQFRLKSPSQIIVNLTDVPTELYWVLYDQKLNEVSASYRKGSLAGSTTVDLQATGQYYIKVWANYSQVTNYPYTIRLSVLPYFE